MIIGFRKYIFKFKKRVLNTQFYYPVKKDLNLKKFNVIKKKDYNLILVENAPLNNVNGDLLLSTSGTGGRMISSLWFFKDYIKKNNFILAINREGNSLTSQEPIKYIEQWQFTLDISNSLDLFLTYKIDNNEISRLVKDIHFIGFSVGGITGLYLAGALVNHNIKKVNMNTVYTSDFINNKIPKEKIRDAVEKAEYKPFYNNYKDRRISKFILLAPCRGLINTRLAEHKIDVFYDNFEKSNKLNKKISINDKGFLFFKDGLLNINGKDILILTGEEDEIVNKELNAEYLANNIKDSKIIKYKKSNHFVFLFQNTEFKNKNYYLEYVIGDKHRTNKNRKQTQKKIIKDILNFLY